MEDRVSGGISGRRVGCKDGSELPDMTDFPDAGHHDIETGDNDTAIEEEKHGDLQTSDNDNYNKSPHITTNRTTSVEKPQQTQQPTEPALNSHTKYYHKHSKEDTSRKTARTKEAQTANVVAIRQFS